MYCRSRASERNLWMLEPFLGWVVDSVRACREPLYNDERSKREFEMALPLAE